MTSKTLCRDLKQQDARRAVSLATVREAVSRILI